MHQNEWMKSLNLLYFFLVIVVVGCIPEQETVYDGINVDFTEQKYQDFYDLQVAQELDSLLLFTSDKDPTIRFLLARAFSSFQDERALDSLITLLDDPEPAISAAAAYSIGQIKNDKALTQLVQAFKAQDSTRTFNRLNANILEAIGKMGDTTMLNYIATADTYKPNDTLLLLGQARGVYQYALRGLSTSKSEEKAIDALLDRSLPDAVRKIYGHALVRLDNPDLSDYENRLYRLWDNEKDVHIKMVLSRLAANVKSDEIKTNFINALTSDIDYRVKIDLMRSMNDYPYIEVVEQMINLLPSENPHVAKEAAEYFINNGIATDATIYKNFIPDNASYTVKNMMYGAILKHLPSYYTRTKNSIKGELMDGFDAVENPYERASRLTALGNDPKNYRELLAYSQTAASAVEKSSAAMAVSNIVNRKDFSQIFGYSQNAVKNEIKDSIISILALHDSGVNAIYGELIGHKDNGLAEAFDDTNAIIEALEASDLPAEIETYNALLKAKAAVEDKPFTPKNIESARSINWKLFESFGDSLYAVINTEKGSIKIKLYPKLVPQTTANFIELANSNFFDGKTVHRVVPNFVIQDGCPRGDGYGSLDYTIRTEVPEIRYEDEGYVGMASAGLHTEGTQWFITHSPTMHLNGRYTIFAKVVEGMSTVHNITVGDKINSIKISK